MATDTTEKTMEVAETMAEGKGDDSKTIRKESSKQSDSATSETADQVQTEQSENQTNLPKTQDELDLLIERAASKQAQSMKDKELSPLQTLVSDLKKEKAKLQKALSQKKEDFVLEDTEDAERDSWADEPKAQVLDFQKARREFQRKKRELDESEDEIKDSLSKAQATERTQQAREMAITHLLAGQGEGFVAQVDSLAKELMECSTQREMELTLRVRGQKFTPEVKSEKKPALTRTDSGRHTAPGGDKEDLQSLLKMDTRKMSYSQLQEHRNKIEKLSKS